MTCVVCEYRPAKVGAYCSNCNSKIDADKRKRKAEKPVKYAHYRGNVVGFFRNGRGKLVPKLLRRKPESLPKGLTLNLNTYVEGMTREQVKKIKAAIIEGGQKYQVQVMAIRVGSKPKTK